MAIIIICFMAAAILTTGTPRASGQLRLRRGARPGGRFRPLYYHDKRAAIFARTFQAILENSTNASATYAGAASGVSAISARGSPSGTILFLDNNTSGNSTAVLNNGAQMALEAGEIAPVVKNFAMTKWLAISEADARIFGIQPQGNLTTLVLYGLAGETVRVGFSLTTGSVTYADPAFAVNTTNVTFSASIVNGSPVSYQLVAGTNSLRVLAMTKNAVDRTWFVDSAGTTPYMRARLMSASSPMPAARSFARWKNRSATH